MIQFIAINRVYTFRRSSHIEKELKRNAFCEIKLRGVYSLIKTIANQAIIYKNNVKYSGDMNLHITIYLRPNKINPSPRIIQNENEKAVFTTIGSPKTFEIRKENLFTLTSSGRKSLLTIVIYPYREGSKINYEVSIPYKIKSNSTSNLTKPQVDIIIERIKSIANE